LGNRELEEKNPKFLIDLDCGAKELTLKDREVQRGCLKKQRPLEEVKRKWG
jgi:hypothetical protein